jgi:hypothetical protein
MSYETLELRFEDCNHTMKMPLLHNKNDSHRFVCHPELRDRPAPALTFLPGFFLCGRNRSTRRR